MSGRRREGGFAMRQRFLVTVLVGFFVLATSATGSGGSAARLEIDPGEGVGPVRLGMAPEEVRAAMGSPNVEREQWVYSEPGLSVLFRDGKVSGLILGKADRKGPKPFPAATPEGISFGTPEEELERHLGPAEGRYENVEEHWTAVSYASRGISFRLSHGRVTMVTVHAPKAKR